MGTATIALTATQKVALDAARIRKQSGLSKDEAIYDMKVFGASEAEAQAVCDEVYSAEAPSTSAFEALKQSTVKTPTIPADSIVPSTPGPVEPAPMAVAIAEKFVKNGGYVIFFPRGTKKCSVPEWEQKTTNNLDAAIAWAQQDLYANVGIVGKQDGLWGLDDDAGLLAEYEKQYGPIQTYGTNTVSGGRHFIFRQNAASWTMGNIIIKDDENRELLSARINNRYVLAAGSWAYPHNDTSRPLTQYTAVDPNASFIEAPVSLLEFIQRKKTEIEGRTTKKNEAAVTNDVSISEGGRNNHLTSIAGKMRQNFGWEYDKLKEELLLENEKKCSPPLPESEVDSIARSVSKYEVKPGDLVVGANERGAAAQVAQTTTELPDLDTGEGAVRPEFPLWAIEGTSIYENLVKPALVSSSKHAEFIFVPAMQMMMNYLSGNVDIELQPTSLNLFVGLVSPYGEFFKSSSCKLAHDYFALIGLCTTTGKDRMAEGKVLIAQAGSPEGFGLAMKRMNCNRAILFNDELGKFVSKAGIEGSSFSSDLLSWYEARPFGNTVTSSKNNFQFDGGTYTFGWLWATTDRGFNRHWPKLAGISSGLEDRMFFVVSPKKPKPTTPYMDPPLIGAIETRKLIDSAMQRKKFQFENHEAYVDRVSGMDPRSMEMVKKLALYFAVDLGLEGMIDMDCVDRAVAMVEYRNQVSAFLEPIEADTTEGRLQKEIRRELKQHRGKLSYRDLCRNLDFMRHGMRVWDQAYRGLSNAGLIFEFPEAKTLGKRTTRMVGLVKHGEDE